MIEHVLHLILLLLAARSFGEIATRIGQPALVGEIGAGLALAVLAASLNAPFLAELSRSAFLDLTAEFGIFFLLLLAGLEIAPGELFRHSGRSAAVALGGVRIGDRAIDRESRGARRSAQLSLRLVRIYRPRACAHAAPKLI